jgi:hypothetical protein
MSHIHADLDVLQEEAEAVISEQKAAAYDLEALAEDLPDWMSDMARALATALREHVEICEADFEDFVEHRIPLLVGPRAPS